MERLTEKHYGANDYYMTCSEECAKDMDCIDCPSFDSLVDRLGAYEDTGLTPEEVNDAVVGSRLLAKSKLVSAFGVAAERLRELAEADKEGRVVALPCKAGDTVWIIPDGKKFALECEVEYANIGKLYATIVLCTKDRLREPYGVATAAFGKTVFLTREEAEAALGRADNG